MCVKISCYSYILIIYQVTAHSILRYLTIGSAPGATLSERKLFV